MALTLKQALSQSFATAFNALHKTTVAPKPTTVTFRPLNLAPVKPASSYLNLGQQYDAQVYNKDGTVSTQKISISSSGSQTYNFTGLTAGNYTEAAQESESQILYNSPSLTPAQLNTVLGQSVRVDYFLCMKSQKSLPLEFNTLQTPSLNSELSYNFYTENETDIPSQEDQSADPLLSGASPPRYVYLTWDVTDTVEASTDFATRTAQEKASVQSYLSNPRGTSTLSNQQTVNSYQANLGNVQPIYKDGKALKLIDTHDMERGFNSTSNSRLFKNAALTIFNTRNIDLATVNLTDLILEDL